jgi:hypothetical protein
MNHKGFYIVGGVLVAVGVYLYYTKNQNTKSDTTSTENTQSSNNAPILGGQSATIPPMTVPNPSGINKIVRPSTVNIRAGAGLKNLTQQQIIDSM